MSVSGKPECRGRVYGETLHIERDNNKTNVCVTTELGEVTLNECNKVMNNKLSW